MTKKDIKDVQQIEEQDKSCFVITPIDSEGSDIRRRTDGLIDSCIIPAVNNFYQKNARLMYHIGFQNLVQLQNGLLMEYIMQI